ncbi:MAG: AbrB/MazE/SpoVT family DNA-binding domain-containing protein [Candidatus Aegiribacteria sp.]|nr:AbrB/MazE/SpoVT family DNA-binding domain-containing protein [Candidatus Aegiribacteria sp.]
MKTKVGKWGNSLAVRIPKVISDDLCISDGTDLEISSREECLILKPVHENYSLKALLSEITNENIHSEIDTGGSVGREEW